MTLSAWQLEETNTTGPVWEQVWQIAGWHRRPVVTDWLTGVQEPAGIVAAVHRYYLLTY